MMPARLGRDDAVHRGGEQRQLEAVRAERPGDVDVIGIARPPRRDDRDVVESVGAARLLASADLYFHDGILGVVADGKRSSEARARTRRYESALTARVRPRRKLQAFDLDVAQQPVDALRIDQPGAEVLGRLRAAGDAVGEALLGRAAVVARGDEAGQERVAGADRGARLDRPVPPAGRGTAAGRSPWSSAASARSSRRASS